MDNITFSNIIKKTMKYIDTFESSREMAKENEEVYYRVLS